MDAAQGLLLVALLGFLAALAVVGGSAQVALDLTATSHGTPAEMGDLRTWAIQGPQAALATDRPVAVLLRGLGLLGVLRILPPRSSAGATAAFVTLTILTLGHLIVDLTTGWGAVLRSGVPQPVERLTAAAIEAVALVTVWVAMHPCSVRGSSSTHSSAGAVDCDMLVDQRQELEQLAARAHNLKMFVRYLGHEVRNPLHASVNSIMGWQDVHDVAAELTATVESKLAGDGPSRDLVTRAYMALEESSEDLLSLRMSLATAIMTLSDVLDYNKLLENKLDIPVASFPIHDFLRRVGTQLHSFLGHDAPAVRISVKPGTPTHVITSERRLHQVLLNAGSNAAKSIRAQAVIAGPSGAHGSDGAGRGSCGVSHPESHSFRDGSTRAVSQLAPMIAESPAIVHRAADSRALGSGQLEHASVIEVEEAADTALSRAAQLSLFCEVLSGSSAVRRWFDAVSPEAVVSPARAQRAPSTVLVSEGGDHPGARVAPDAAIMVDVDADDDVAPVHAVQNIVSVSGSGPRKAAIRGDPSVLLAAKHVLAITVRDSGTGLKSVNIQNLFQDFDQAKEADASAATPGSTPAEVRGAPPAAEDDVRALLQMSAGTLELGTGIGLALMRRIVVDALHGVVVLADRQDGQPGAEFSVLVPTDVPSEQTGGISPSAQSTHARDVSQMAPIDMIAHSHGSHQPGDVIRIAPRASPTACSARRQDALASAGQRGRSGAVFALRERLIVSNVSADAISEHSSEAQSLESSRQPRVLIADDDRSNIRVLSRMLRNLGFAVVAVSDGVEVLRELGLSADSAYASTEPEFDFIIMDVAMHVMNGDVAADAIRKAGNRTPIIFASGHVTIESNAHLMSFGNTRVLAKPFTAHDVSSAMAALRSAAETER